MKSIAFVPLLAFSVLWGSHPLRGNTTGVSQQGTSEGKDGITCDNAVIMYGNCNCTCCYNSFINGQLVTVNCKQANSNDATVNILGVDVPISNDDCAGGCATGTQCALVILNVADPTAADPTTVNRECCTATDTTNVLNCPSDSQCNLQREEDGYDDSTNFCCSQDRSNCRGSDTMDRKGLLFR